MITVEVDTSKAIVWLSAMPEKVHQKVRNAVDKLTILLQNRVRGQKLAGQVLKYHTHHLQQSIQRRVEDSATSVVGIVFNNKALAPYGAIHEYGGVIPAHEIVAKKAQALAFLWNGKMSFFKKVQIPNVTMPERSFLRSSLSDMQGQIIADLKQAVIDGTK